MHDSETVKCFEAAAAAAIVARMVEHQQESLLHIFAPQLNDSVVVVAVVYANLHETIKTITR